MNLPKHRANRGETGGLSFYRDRDGVEVDLVVEGTERRTLVEAKAAETASPSLFDGVRRVQRLLAREARPLDAVVVYGGTEAQERSAVRPVPWYSLHRERWTEAR